MTARVSGLASSRLKSLRAGCELSTLFLHPGSAVGTDPQFWESDGMQLLSRSAWRLPSPTVSTWIIPGRRENSCLLLAFPAASLVIVELNVLQQIVGVGVCYFLSAVCSQVVSRLILW